MGSIIGKEILKNKEIKKENFYLVDKNIEKTNYFLKNGCKVYLSVNDIENNILNSFDLIIFAIKPQEFSKMNFVGKLNNNIKILSVMAGISINKISNKIGADKILRIMPNTPISIGKGVMGYYFSKSFKEDEKKEILNLIKNFGLFVLCKDEEQINSITVISGSGPAYFYRILEIFQKQAVEFGFSELDARKMVLQTLLGSGLLAEKGDKNFAELRKEVTLKGGTTEKALKYFDENSLEKILLNGILEAKLRAKSL